MKTVIIVATSRKNGNTTKSADALASVLSADIIDLTHYQLSYYDYQHQNQDDDFLTLVEQVLQYDLIVYASPVYWYAMSGQMKVFFDRLTDLLTVKKLMGRALKNKYNAVISTGAEATAPDCFVKPFALTAGYFDMIFLGNFYFPVFEQEVAINAAFEQYIATTAKSLMQSI
ncbi:flavodoxin family protein [Thalassotalea sp. 1_MG-2023]|uniref:flavodoxin family protein n=1 Tax=Thalassotalea sp. 1_MG-2023 TaxID=3062680 RepID=UPI0026E3A3A5|nr:flavodoxin family protein [Thalassotalea sp. 1_MG-2023]MDO6426026.1 flavodoxin family protein [Thalassotalea sp. 1_MG-2023]